MRQLTDEERKDLDDLDRRNREATDKAKRLKNCTYCHKPVKGEPMRIVPAGKFHEACWEQRANELDRELRRQKLEAQGIDPDSDSDEWEGAEI